MNSAAVFFLALWILWHPPFVLRPPDLPSWKPYLSKGVYRFPPPPPPAAPAIAARFERDRDF